MTTTTDTPRVWIACLAAYNEGHLHGRWVDATDADEMYEAGKEIIASSPAHYAEELAIHDYDGFGNLSSKLGEYPSFFTLAKIGALIEQHGEAFLAFVEACEPDLNEADEIEDKFESAFAGEADSENDYAYEYVGLTGGWGGIEIPDELEMYLDWDKIADALFDYGDYVYQDGYVFNTNI